MGVEYLRCARVLAVLALPAAAVGCKTTSSSVAVKEPAITWLDLEVTDLGFAEYRVRLEGEIESPERAMLELNRYELVENGRVVKQGQVPIKEPITPGEITIFHLDESSPFAAPDALPGPGGRSDSALIAVRGKLILQHGGRLQELNYAQAKEVRLPRLPSVRVHELDAARYSDKELHVTLRLAVINPNPFPVPLKGLEFVASVAARQIGSGSLANGETIDPSATALFEIGIPITAKTYGPDVNQLIRTASFPYKLTGTLKGHSFEAPFELAGNIRLGSAK
jgi:Late embryogenesis abundant protein